MDTMTQPALTLELTRHFTAAPERVFDAWLTKDWSKWLPPRGATCSVEAMDVRVGGNYRLAMTMSDGRQVEIYGDYREIVRPERLVLAWTGNYNHQETVLTLTFAPDGAGTLLTLQQSGFLDPQMCDGYRMGWTGEGGSFEKLDLVLAGG